MSPETLDRCFRGFSTIKGTGADLKQVVVSINASSRQRRLADIRELRERMVMLIRVSDLNMAKIPLYKTSTVISR
jgi:hypothetical protein